MDQRQNDLLTSIVEQIAYVSVVRLSKRQLRHLHSAERLGKNTWRDLEQRLPRGITSKDVSFIDEDDDIYLIRNSDLGTLSDVV